MIREQVRSAASGVPVLIAGLAGIAASVWLFVASVQRPPTPAGIILGVAGVLLSMFVLMGLKIVNPNEARVLQLFGSYRGHRQDAGPALGAAAHDDAERVAAHPQLRELAPQGERPRRQPDRDRRGRGVARRRHRGGAVRGRRLRELRARPERGGAAQPRHQLSLRRARRSAHLAARPHRGGRRAPEARDPGSARQGRRRGARGAHQPPRLRAGDRRGDAAAAAGRRDHRGAPAHRRGRGRHGGDGARRCCRTRASSRSTRSARRRWSATCWSCCAASAAPSRSSTPARSISSGGPR